MAEIWEYVIHVSLHPYEYLQTPRRVRQIDERESVCVRYLENIKAEKAKRPTTLEVSLNTRWLEKTRHLWL
jgi:hypothetical protein